MILCHRPGLSTTFRHGLSKREADLRAQMRDFLSADRPSLLFLPWACNEVDSAPAHVRILRTTSQFCKADLDSPALLPKRALAGADRREMDSLSLSQEQGRRSTQRS